MGKITKVKDINIAKLNNAEYRTFMARYGSLIAGDGGDSESPDEISFDPNDPLGIPAELPAPPYIQVLGARKTALSRLKQAALPAGTSLADLARSGTEAAKISELHSKAVDFSALCRVETQPMGLAFTTKPVVV